MWPKHFERGLVTSGQSEPPYQASPQTASAQPPPPSGRRRCSRRARTTGSGLPPARSTAGSARTPTQGQGLGLRVCWETIQTPCQARQVDAASVHMRSTIKYKQSGRRVRPGQGGGSCECVQVQNEQTVKTPCRAKPRFGTVGSSTQPLPPWADARRHHNIERA